jgi:anionic cell wall polymer biosynthesis LytR-Cps2A-Psr (LCP) family protein
MRVTTSAGSVSGSELYSLYGRDHIVSRVSAMTGLSIDYYLVVNVTELSQIISNMGGINMYLTQDLYYNGQIATTQKPAPGEEDLIPLLYTIGNNDIDGAGATALMMHNEMDSAAAVNARNTFLVNFLTAVMDKLTAMPETDLTAFYDDICENAMVDTTFAVPDFISEISLIYAWNDPSFKKTTLEYPGRYVAATDSAAGYFEPNTNQAINLFKNYRPLPEADTAGDSK